MVIVLMGAAGAGKTTVGRRLSEQLRWTFVDGDELHSPANIAKMAHGTPLTDEDRRPWLDALRKSITAWIEQGTDAIVACSLLTERYRDSVLSGSRPHVQLVYLQASRTLLNERLTARAGHFAGVSLLDSQLAVLEEPQEALVLDASKTPDQLVQTIRSTLRQ
ncbi:MAG TPA: gluconokinase [Nitrospira sp.]|nr:gluconokinase [Nitrospira sp.]